MHSFCQERSPSPEIEFDNLEKFVIEPAAQGLTVKCRVTRDQRGMDKNFYPLYYLHLDNDKKVSDLSVTVSDWLGDEFVPLEGEVQSECCQYYQKSKNSKDK